MESWPVNPVDAFVLGAVVLSGILALIRGLVREVLSLLSWAIAIAAGVKLAPFGKSMGLSMTDNDTIATAIGGFIIFFLVLLVLTILSHYLAKAVRESALSTVDRSLGFLFGAARGFLVAVLVYLGGTMLFAADEQPAWLQAAQTEPSLRASANWIHSLMPEDMRKDLDKSLGTGKEAMKEGTQQMDTLERLSQPVPSANPEEAAVAKPEYDDATKQKLDDLINKNAIQPQQVDPIQVPLSGSGQQPVPAVPQQPAPQQ
ncbi:MAG: CvpA family protein [Bdellovibrionales bacterium]